jgi:integrase
MIVTSVENLHKAGRPGKRRWRVYYRLQDSPRRLTKYLGPAEGPEKLSKRQAELVKQDWLQLVGHKPHKARKVEAPKLKDFLDRYRKSRTNLAVTTQKQHELTCRYLLQFFGEEIKINRITPSMATDWLSELVTGKLRGAHRETATRKTTLKSEASACLHVRNAKRIFRMALDELILDDNPFKHLTGRAPIPDKNWHFVTREEFRQLLKGCRNSGWKAFLGLQRLAGLRRHEAYDLRWKDVDFKNHQVRVFGGKTARTKKRSSPVRYVPMNGELEALLKDALMDRVNDQEHVVRRDHVASNNFIVRIKQVARRAEITLWASPFQCLRRSRATELAEGGLPTHAHAEYLGHSIDVAQNYYLQVRDRSFKLAREL